MTADAPETFHGAADAIQEAGRGILAAHATAASAAIVAAARLLQEGREDTRQIVAEIRSYV